MKNTTKLGSPIENEWVLSLYRAMQAAIGEQLKKELETPEDLTPELAALANRMEKQKGQGRSN